MKIMKTYGKRILALLLTLAICSSVVVIAQMSGAAADSPTPAVDEHTAVLFEEDYESTPSTYWNKDINISIDPKTKSNANLLKTSDSRRTLTGLTTSEEWTDYTIEATVSPAAATGKGFIMPTLIARQQKGNAYGYEFRVSINSSLEYVNAELYCRGGSGASPVNGKKLQRFDVELKDKVKKPEPNSTIKLKMKISGNQITCYLNDQVVFEESDNTYSAGTAGYSVSANSGTTGSAYFDNFKVTGPAPEYGDWYEDNFVGEDGAAIDPAWEVSDPKWKPTLSEKGGVTTLANGGGMFLTGHPKASEWNDYVVEADLTFAAATEQTGTNGNDCVASIVGRASSGQKTRYEFAIMATNPKGQEDGFKKIRYRLNYRDAGVFKAIVGGTAGISLDGITDSYSVKPSEKFHLKMLFKGKQIICSIGFYSEDGTRKDYVLIDCEDNTEGRNTTGTGGIYASACKVTYENFAIRAVTDEDLGTITLPEQDPINGAWFQEQFNDDNLTDRGWISTKTPKLENGRLKNPSTLFWNGESLGAKSNEFAEYTVQADVTLYDDDTKKGTDSGTASLVGHMNKVDNKYYGIELGLMYTRSTKKTEWRLYLRSENKAGQVDRKSTINGDSIEMNKPYRLKLVITKDTVSASITPLFGDNEGVEDWVAKDISLSNYPGLEKGSFGISAGNLSETTYDNFTVTDFKGTWFKDEFEGESVNSVWKPKTEIELSTDTFTNSGNGMKLPVGSRVWVNLPTAQYWTDYVVEADVTFSKSNKGNNASPSIVARSDYSNNKSVAAYEFRANWVRTPGTKDGVVLDDTKAANIQLIRRTADNKTLLKSENIDQNNSPVRGESYHIKLVVSGNKQIGIFTYNGISCKIETEYTDYEMGFAGFFSSGSDSIIDNYIVRSVTAEDLGEEPEPPVEPEYGDWYEDNFVGKQGEPLDPAWEVSDTKWKPTLSEKGGITTPVNGGGLFLTGHPNAEIWSDYVVEADITFAAAIEQTYNNANGILASIVGRTSVQTKPRYEFSITATNPKGKDEFKNVKFRLGYRDAKYNSIVDEKSLDGLTWFYRVVPEEKFHLKMVFKGKRIICSIGLYDETGARHDYVLIDIVDNNVEHNAAGTAGIYGSACKATYENFVIRAVADEDIPKEQEDVVPDLKPGEVWFKDDFSDYDSSTFADHGWNNEYVQLGGNGDELKLTQGGWTLYLTDYPGAKYWKDYELSADVRIDQSQGETFFGTGASTSLISIVSRCQSTTTGYEFGITLTPDGKTAIARLYDRGNLKMIKQTASVKIERNVTYHLRMTVVGNRIQCWIGDQQIFDLTDNTYASGFIGLRANGSTAYVDNVKVVGYSTQNPSAPSGPTNTPGSSSPATGETTAWPVAAALGFVALAVCSVMVVRRRKAQ